jgi:DNA-binding response OmpR family regulator
VAKIILLVDDSLMIHRIVGLLLKEGGFKVLHADDGRKGYELAKTERPDLIIMDVEMPNMNGFEATKLIKSEPSVAGIPLIILTSLGSEDDMRRAEEAGANGFLNKPISRDDLVAKIHFLLSGAGAGPGA